MAKGFIRGTLWGAGVSFGAVTLLSLMSADPQYRGQGGDASVLRTSDASAPGSNRGKDGLGPTAVGLATQDVPAPKPDTLAALLSDALSPAAVPQTGGASALPQTAPLQDSALSGIATPDTEAPAVRYSSTGSLEVPATEPGLPISTEPAQPPQPNAVPQATAFVDPEVPQAPAVPSEPEMVAGNADVAAPDEQQPAQAGSFEIGAIALDPDQPALPSAQMPATAFEPEMPAASEAPAAEQAEVVAVVAAPAPAEVVPPAPAPEVAQTTQQPVPASVPETVAVVAAIAAQEPSAPAVLDVADLPQPDAKEVESKQDDSTDAQVSAELVVETPQTVAPSEVAPSVDVTASPAPELPGQTVLPEIARIETVLAPAVQQTADRIVPTQAQAPAAPAEDPQSAPSVEAPSAAVRVNRLPSLGSATPEVDAVPEDEPETAAAQAPVEGDALATPMERYRVPFEAPDGKPLMAVILMDEGIDLQSADNGLAAISALPYPVSFAVNALMPDAAERMAAYRAAGFEVLAGIDLPAGATATDAEVNLSVALEKLPEVIGVFEGTDTGVQTTPMAGRQVAQILAQTGHGFVTQNRGLNTVQKLALREGVPARAVFRDLDGKDQSEVVIRRFMDQAAFRAGQDGGVVMLGRVRPETLAALLSWSLQDRAATVAMAPVSAVLTQQP